MKTAVVTGANVGIGFETAAGLVSQGYRTILACRSVEKGDAALKQIKDRVPEGQAEVRNLDLADFSSIRQFADELEQAKMPVHVLVNNAGVMACPEMKTKDGLELQMGVNHYGHFLLTSLLYPRMKNLESGARIVNVSSSAHRRGTMDFENINSEKSYSRWPAYCRSKLANVLFTYELARRIPKEDNVTVNVCHPGVIATELMRYLIPENPRFLNRTLNYVAGLLFKTPAQGAETSVHLASSPEVAQVTGKYFEDCKEAQTTQISHDPNVAKRLWDMSVNLTGAKWDF